FQRRQVGGRMGTRVGRHCRFSCLSHCIATLRHVNPPLAFAHFGCVPAHSRFFIEDACVEGIVHERVSKTSASVDSPAYFSCPAPLGAPLPRLLCSASLAAASENRLT